jgi:hypothetical protein
VATDPDEWSFSANLKVSEFDYAMDEITADEAVTRACEVGGAEPGEHPVRFLI